MKNVKAYWSFDLMTECPECEADLNLDNMDGFSYVSDLELQVLEQDTDKSTNIEIECPYCNHTFKVDCIY